MAKSRAGQKFDEVSKQRVDYQALPGGGQRARLTVTLAGSSRPFVFVEDISPSDVARYRQQIAGVEVGLIQSVNGIVRVGAAPNASALVKKMFATGDNKFAALTQGGIAKTAGTVVKGVATAAKAIATSKVMQTAAKGLALLAPALGPLAPVALGASGAIGVAGKVLGAKNAEAAGALATAASIAQSAVSDAKKIAPQAFGSLLQIASEKATAAQRVAGAAPSASASALPFGQKLRAAAAPAGGDAMQLVAAGRVHSDQGGPVTADQLLAARRSGRVFFVRS